MYRFLRQTDDAKKRLKPYLHGTLIRAGGSAGGTYKQRINLKSPWEVNGRLHAGGKKGKPPTFDQVEGKNRGRKKRFSVGIELAALTKGVRVGETLSSMGK